MVEEVLIDFKVDYSELTSAQEQLAKGGKIDSSQFSNLSKGINTAANDTKGLIAQFKSVATTATRMGKSVEDAFGAGIQDALDEAGVSMEDFADALGKANQPAKSLKAELRELKEALALAKANGTDTGVEFDKLRDRAGKLSDAIADAGAEIKNAGSDTRNIDNVVGSISALAGGFAAAQGAAALFGSENEDVQKALLTVNGAMAVASGIQQFYNATLKEGSITKLADSVATGVMSAAQTIYTIAVGTSTGALKAFRIALLATGIGAIIVLLALAADAMGLFGDSTDDTTKSMADQKEAADALVNSLGDIANAAKEARASQAGGTDEIKRQIEIAKAKGNNSKEVFNLEQKLRQKEIQELGILGQTYLEEYKARQKAGTLSAGDAEALKNKINEINRDGKDKNNEIAAAGYSYQKELADKAAKNAKEAADRAKAARLAGLNDDLAILQLRLAATTKGTQKEIDIQKQIVHQKSIIELENEKLTKNQRLLIQKTALNDQLELQKEFNQKATELELQALISNNSAILAGITATNEERLRLNIENIETTAQLEINAAGGNANKILLIEAKKLSDIRALRNAAIEKQLADELSSTATLNSIVAAALAKVAADQKNSAAVRIAALRGIANQALIDVDKEIAANKAKEQSIEAFTAKEKELADKRLAIRTDTAQKIQQVEDETLQHLKENRQKEIQEVLQVAGMVADFYGNLSSLASEQEQARIAEQKRQLEGLVEAGAITAKDAEARAKQIEILERQAKQRQAQREKNEAVFKAIIAIPQAVLTGLTQGGPVLAAIYGALAAAQAALIIARPVPKFFRGKKNNYEGMGIVGDMGSELVERNGRMYLYTSPTQTYLGAKDKVYTAGETRQILHNTDTRIEPTAKPFAFDYDRLAKSIPKHSVNIGINKDFVKESVKDALYEVKHFDKWYKF
jgi:hypothetical protein